MVIILLIIGILLIIVNIKAIKKEENSFHNVLKYNEKDISKIELEFGQFRKDIAESITELQKEIYQLKGVSSEKNTEELSDDFEETNDNENVISEINFQNKTERIKKLLDNGLSVDQVCKELSLGRGEVLLVQNLYKK